MLSLLKLLSIFSPEMQLQDKDTESPDYNNAFQSNDFH